MFEDIETHKKLSKWIIGTFTACILIYLGIRHISHVADAVMWLKDLLNPLLIGLILALFLNVPLGVIERHLFPKHPTSRKTKMRRPLAILLSFILVIGVFVGVAFLVIPELIDAVSIVIAWHHGSFRKAVRLPDPDKQNPMTSIHKSRTTGLI